MGIDALAYGDNKEKQLQNKIGGSMILKMKQKRRKITSYT